MKKLIHLYFDWNIFKYIKSPRNENDKKFAQLINSIKDYILIAYSPFHISGLLKNYDKSKHNYIIKDCELITELTNNLCIYKDDEKVKLEYRDPLQMFNDRVSSEQMNKELLDPKFIYKHMTEKQKKEFENNYNKIKNDESLKNVDDPFIRAMNKSNSAAEAFENIITMQGELQTDPTTYKQIRSNITTYKSDYNNLTESQKEQINTKLRELGIKKELSELDENDFLKISESTFKGKINTGISNKYTFKDLFGITKPEKMSKKNSFKNIIDDSFHLDLAQSSLYYISDDKGNLEKARLINNENNLGMEIFNIEQAIKSIGISLYTIKNNELKN